MKNICAKLTLFLALLGVKANGQTFSVIYSFDNTNGPLIPKAALVQGSGGNFYGTTTHMIFSVTTNGAVTTLTNFGGANGLTLGMDGLFYGTTSQGGSNQAGSVFRMTTNGLVTTMVNFIYSPFHSDANGSFPTAPLTLGPDGNFYGTTSSTVFQMKPNGMLTTFTNLNGTTGSNPNGPLVLGPDGNLYGTASASGPGSAGSVFRITTNGVFTLLVSFNVYNGAFPQAGLALGPDNSLYGTTEGANGQGTVFRITVGGDLTNLFYFSASNSITGANPFGGLTLGPDGNFYGTTSLYGSSGNGTVFRITTNGILTVLHSFSAKHFDQTSSITNSDGAIPETNLTLGSDGHLYGTTSEGGVGGGGTIYRLTISDESVISQPSTISLVPNNVLGSITVYMSGVPNSTNRLWATTNLALQFGEWQAISTNVLDSNGHGQFLDSNAIDINAKYYRLSVP